MERRHFLKQTAKLTAGGLITASMIGVLGCKSLHDFYSFDGSLKNGISWSNFQLSINFGSEGTYDTTSVSHPTVIKDGSTYKMWYTGVAVTNQRIIYAESSNGISWSNFQLSINLGSQGTYDTVHATSPSVINVGGVGKMWYAGRSGGIDRIIYAESR